MSVKTVSLFNSPCDMPNGIQWADNKLFVIDQKTDDVFVLNQDGKLISTIKTPTENGSGITVGGGYIWTASNGRTQSRAYRPTDTHLGYIYKLNMETGELIDKYRTPDGGGIHGIEWDNGFIWVTAFNPPAIFLLEGHSLSVVRKFNVKLTRLHGLALDGEGIWCAHTTDNVIVKYHTETGEQMDIISISKAGPFMHGLSIKDGVLWYADANAGVENDPETKRGYPEIGYIERT